ncbi:DUF1127 domain-containing protein [Paracoccus onubensis]|uniref:DUF1127 domain-containing protein n=1 Tax=Paracoccus onubensis TaxID=1675788 RepID=A0A418T216_9RHOB|nr:DUF1127 domain-containing protein [Paracoccus onubensis]
MNVSVIKRTWVLLCQRLVLWSGNSRHKHRLSKLDDHLLDDIGITREEAKKLDGDQ